MPIKSVPAEGNVGYTELRTPPIMLATILQYKGRILIVAAVLIALRCVWLWQPARQVDLHQRHFLEAAQDRKWAKLAAFFADDFRTPTGRDKKWALQQSGEILRQFIALDIRASQTEVAMSDDTARIHSLIRMEGTGTQLAMMAMSAVNDSPAPFEFTWKHKSWKPWDWQLVSVDHPLLHTAGDIESF